MPITVRKEILMIRRALALLLLVGSLLIPQRARALPLHPIPAGQTLTVCQRAVQAAVSKMGSPYVSGAKGPNSFDCSGLTQWAYGQAGVHIGTSTYQQITEGTAIPCTLAQLNGTASYYWQLGDLLFLTYPESWAPGGIGHHVAMYIGDGWF